MSYKVPLCYDVDILQNLEFNWVLCLIITSIQNAILYLGFSVFSLPCCLINNQLLQATTCYRLSLGTGCHLLQTVTCYSLSLATVCYSLLTVICYKMSLAADFHLLQSVTCFGLSLATGCHLSHWGLRSAIYTLVPL